MAKYHKYVLKKKKRELVGDFETMYQNESKENFDSWHQDDSRQLQRKIDLAILEDYNFNKILDIGCGKGSLTHILKKKNNTVIGLDISQTAVDIASERFPDIDFMCSDVNTTSNYNHIVENMGGVNLVFTSEVFSYIENWKELLNEISKTTEYFMISLYIPKNPIGFIKSENDLVNEISKSFNIIEHISLNTTDFVVVFAKGKKEDEF